MDVKLIGIGYGNVATANKIIAVISPSSSPIKRLIQEAKDKGILINAACGRKVRSVIVTDSGHIILSALQPETIGRKL